MDRRWPWPWEAIAVAVVASAFAIAFTYPVWLRLGQRPTYGDWDQHLVYHLGAVAAVSRYGQLPLWNPYYCGGVPLLANPQSRVMTPFFGLHLLAGPVTALELEIVAHLAIAAAGAYTLARVARLRPPASALTALTWAGSSWFPLHLAAGHTTWLAYAYIPWLYAALLRAWSTRHTGWLLGAGLLIALAVGEGGFYALSEALLFASAMAAVEAFRVRSAWPVVALVLSMSIGAGLAAPKLLPSLILMASHPRPTPAGGATGWGPLLAALTERRPRVGTSVAGFGYGFWELGAYLSPGTWPLLAAGLLRTGAARRWLLPAGLAAMIALGAFADYAPWRLLHLLPPYSSEDVPTRFLILFILFAGLVAGHGFDRLARAGRSWRAAACLLAATAALDCWLVAPPALTGAFNGSDPTIGLSGQFRQVAGGGRDHMYPIASVQLGALDCYEPIPIAVAAVADTAIDYRGEQYLERPGQVTALEWSPARLVYSAASPTPNVLVVNQNYDPGWQAEPGANVFDDRGRLAVSIPAGQTTVALTYDPPSFRAGLAIALLTAMAASVALTRVQVSAGSLPWPRSQRSVGRSAGKKASIASSAEVMSSGVPKVAMVENSQRSRTETTSQTATDSGRARRQRPGDQLD